MPLAVDEARMALTAGERRALRIVDDVLAVSRAKPALELKELLVKPPQPGRFARIGEAADLQVRAGSARLAFKESRRSGAARNQVLGIGPKPGLVAAVGSTAP
jgi:hypothetical protein